MLRLISTTIPVITPSCSYKRTQCFETVVPTMGPPAGMLSFEDQKIKMDSSADAEEVARKIEEFKHLTVLELKGNTVGVEAGYRLAEALQSHPELERCLWSDIFTGRLKSEIPTILVSMCSAMMQAGCHITELDLSDNAFGPIGAQGISEFLVSPSAYSLEVLRLNNNGLGAGGKTVAQCLLECSENAKKEGKSLRLKTFVAGRNRLENPGAKALARAFSEIGTLEVISIPQNGIRSEGIAALAGALEHNPKLQVINFNDNTCGVEGAIAIAQCIGDLVDLEVLDLGDCLCRDVGVGSVIGVLCDGEHHKLQLVDFSGSELSSTMADQIMDSWIESYGDMEGVKLRLTNNCFGSRFTDLAELGANYNMDFGDESDDEGSLSERDSGSEGEDSEGGEDAGSEVSPPKLTERPAAGASGDDGIEELLRGVGCMRMKAGGEPDKMETGSGGILSFLDNQLKLNSREDAEPLASKIETERVVKVLELRGNTLGVEAGKRVAEALKKHPELERCLWSDLFTGRLKTEIPTILSSLCSAMMQTSCHITELDLSDNAFGPIGAEGIMEFLVSPSAYSLEVLKLNNNGLGAGGKVVAACLSECHDKSSKAGRPLRLKTFIAGRNRLEIPGATALAAAFKKIGSLEELVVHQNGIGAKGIEALASCLPFNPNLRIVNFNDNTATQSGSYALATAIKSLCNLESVCFGDCLCRDAGCHAIVDSLSPTTHTKLTELDLSGAELTGEAAIQICAKWTKFPAARLNISSNNFGGLFDDVMEAAAAAGANVDLGDEDDDQGSLSDDEEERNSEPDSTDDDDSIQEVTDENRPPGHCTQIKELQSRIEQIEAEFESSHQEAAARLLLQLAIIVQESNENEMVLKSALDVASDVVSRVKSVRRRPIPTTTQLVNQIVAQLGFIKPEVSWGLRPSAASMLRILRPLIQQGLLTDEEATISYYFK